MDDKTVDNALETAKAGSKAFENLTGTLDKLVTVFCDVVGPGARETGLTIGEWVKGFRLVQTVKTLQLGEKILRDAGFEPKPVPPRVLIPILEAASLESNDELHNKWASLLASAADPRRQTALPPYFVEILKQLTPFEAQLLSGIWLYSPPEMPTPFPHERGLAIIPAFARPSWTLKRLLALALEKEILPVPPQSEITYIPLSKMDVNDIPAESLVLVASVQENFVRLGLLMRSSGPEMSPNASSGNSIEFEITYTLTTIGYEFLKACAGPESAVSPNR